MQEFHRRLRRIQIIRPVPSPWHELEFSVENQQIDRQSKFANTCASPKFRLIPIYGLQWAKMSLARVGGIEGVLAMWCCSRRKASLGGKKVCVGRFVAQGNFKQLSMRLVGEDMMHIDLAWYFLDVHGQASARIRSAIIIFIFM